MQLACLLLTTVACDISYTMPTSDIVIMLDWWYPPGRFFILSLQIPSLFIAVFTATVFFPGEKNLCHYPILFPVEHAPSLLWKSTNMQHLILSCNWANDNPSVCRTSLAVTSCVRNFYNRNWMHITTKLILKLVCCHTHSNVWINAKLVIFYQGNLVVEINLDPPITAKIVTNLNSKTIYWAGNR